MFKKILGCLAVVSWMLVAPDMALAAPETHPAGDWMCPCPGGEKPLGGASSCEEACYGSRRSSTPSRDYEAERRAQEQADAHFHVLSTLSAPLSPKLIFLSAL